MLNKKTAAEILRVGVMLFVITAVAAMILACVNTLTAPVIAENNKITEEKAMRAVLPSAESFEVVEFKADENSCVTAIYSGGEAGAVVKVSPNGYGGEISMLVGVDESYKVTGVEIISQSETAGLGANCVKQEFKNRFVGKSGNIEVVKKGAEENQIDAISSATITSKAVTKGVNEAVAKVKEMRGGK